MPVELVMHVSRGLDNRLTGTVRTAQIVGVREFSGTLELMRVLEDLVPVDRGGPHSHPANANEEGGSR